jgi:PASTA domain-containing protein
MAVLAAAAFSTTAAVAQADVMAPGTWDGQVSAGTINIGDGDLQSIAVPGGDAFTVTIPTGASAPVAFRAPATHIPIPAHTFVDPGGAGTWSASGSLDVSPIDGTVTPATGAVAGTASAHGLLRLDVESAGGSTSLYCQLGGAPAPPSAPSPFALNLLSTGAWSAASGDATLGDATFALQLNCGAPFITPDLDLAVVGHPVMPAGTNSLALTVKFTRRPDPTPPPATVTPKPKPPLTTPKPVTPVVKCIVPKLKGMSLKQARKAAKKANCAVGSIKRKKSGRRATTVLKQAKRAGTVLDQGSKISLTVAKK